MKTCLVRKGSWGWIIVWCVLYNGKPSFFDVLPNVTVESDWIWPCFVTIFAQGRNVVWILFVAVFYDIASLFVIYLYRHNGRSNVSSKPKRETGDAKKQNSSKDRKDRTSQTLQCYLQRSSHGGIMLLELVFEVWLNDRLSSYGWLI